MSDTQEVLIRMTVWPSHLNRTPWLIHDAAFGTSIVSIAHEVDQSPGPITITDVYLQGHGRLVHRVVDATTVIVSPRIPDQGCYLTIRCEAPCTPWKDRTGPHPGTPSPDDSYGLQRAAFRSSGQRA